ncbi:MAG: ATP-binding cassette domain-containing protein [Anaerolineae bacterium]|nr:ATP-binding cassette domain-containing protein [Anaerolineae bacterium]
MNIIHTVGLSRRYKNFQAVDKLNLEVPSGSVYGFLGPNGAGKTTTIRMLLGLIQPTGGNAHLFGLDVADSRQRPAILKRVGALVEMPALYPHLSGRENLEVTRLLLNADKQHIDRVLKIVNLMDAADKPTKTYSLGMKQRLGLALALLNQPELLILDEPTNGLDPAGIHEIRDLIRMMPQEYGITVFLSSHLLSEIEIMATHLGIVNGGRMLFQGTLASLQAQRESHLLVGVRSPVDAVRYLNQSGWSAVQQNGHVKVTAHDPADAALINAALVKQGMHVHHLTLEQPTLEDMFLQMTGNN